MASLREILKRRSERKAQEKQLADVKVPAPTKKESLYVDIKDVSSNGNGDLSYSTKDDVQVYTGGSGGRYVPVTVVKKTPTPSTSIAAPTKDVKTARELRTPTKDIRDIRKGTYDRATQTYTDIEGRRQSMAEWEAIKSGAKITDSDKEMSVISKGGKVEKIKDKVKEIFVKDEPGESIVFTPTTTTAIDKLKDISAEDRLKRQEGEKLLEDIKKTGTGYKETIHYEIPKAEKEYKKLIEGKINEAGEFTGTATEFRKQEIAYNKLSSLYKEAEQEFGKIESSQKELDKLSKTFSFFDYKKKVPITDVKNIFSYVPLQVRTIAEQAGKGIGTMYGEITKAGILPPLKRGAGESTMQLLRGEITGKEFKAGFKEIKPDVVYDLVGGQVRVPTKEDITPPASSMRYIQPAQVEKAATKAIQTGAYFLPLGVGAGIFGAEVAETGLDIAETLKEGKKLTKEQITKGALLGATVLTVGAIKGTRAYKQERMFGKPKGVEYDIRPLVTTKAKVVSVPRRVKLQQDGIKLLDTQRRGGRQIVYEPYTYGMEITAKGKRYVERQITDATGKTIGIIEKKSILGKYGKTYTTRYETLKSGKIKYKVYKDGKLVKKGIQEEGGKLFGALEPKLISRTKKPGVQVIEEGLEPGFKKGKEGVLRKKEIVEEKLGQEFILLKDTKKLKLTQKEPFTYKTTTAEVMKIKPAETTIGVAAKVDGQTIVLKYPLKKQVAKVSKKEGADILRFGKPGLYEGGLIYPYKAFKSPTFEQKIVKTLEGKGGFTITKKGRMERITDVLTEKAIKGEGLRYASLSPVTTLATVVKTPKVKVPKVGVVKEFGIATEFKLPPRKIKPVALDSEKTTMQEIKAIELTGIKEKQLFGMGQETKLGIGTTSKTKQRQRQKQEQEQILKQKQIQKVTQKVKQKLRQEFVMKPIQATQFKSPTLRVIPKVPIPKVPSPKDALKEIANGEFKIFAKKAGVDVEIGKAKTKEAAEELLKKELKETLRASGFVTLKGQKVKISDFGKSFRPGKKDQFRVVEKKAKRIKRKEKSREAEEIQFFRKKRGSSNGFF